jgi:hypothetical protein
MGPPRAVQDILIWHFVGQELGSDDIQGPHDAHRSQNKDDHHQEVGLIVVMVGPQRLLSSHGYGHFMLRGASTKLDKFVNYRAKDRTCHQHADVIKASSLPAPTGIVTNGEFKSYLFAKIARAD